MTALMFLVLVIVTVIGCIAIKRQPVNDPVNRPTRRLVVLETIASVSLMLAIAFLILMFR